MTISLWTLHSEYVLAPQYFSNENHDEGRIRILIREYCRAKTYVLNLLMARRYDLTLWHNANGITIVYLLDAMSWSCYDLMLCLDAYAMTWLAARCMTLVSWCNGMYCPLCPSNENMCWHHNISQMRIMIREELDSHSRNIARQRHMSSIH